MGHADGVVFGISMDIPFPEILTFELMVGAPTLGPSFPMAHLVVTQGPTLRNTTAPTRQVRTIPEDF